MFPGAAAWRVSFDDGQSERSGAWPSRVCTIVSPKARLASRSCLVGVMQACTEVRFPPWMEPKPAASKKSRCISIIRRAVWRGEKVKG